MQETTRLHYLRTMGITNYMPRWQLSGAPASVLNRNLGTAPAKPASAKDSPKSLAQSLDATSSTEDKASPSQPLDAIRALAEPSSAGAGAQINDTQAPKTPAPETAAPPTLQPGPTGPAKANKPADYQADKLAAKASVQSGENGREKVSFALSFWRVSEDLMVVDSRHSELALPVEKLLNNILFALGYPRQLPKVDALSWPMVDAPHQDQGENAARDTLHGFIDELFLLNPGKHILLMGEDASRYILNHDSDYSEQLGSQFVVEEFGLSAIVVPSLSNMLQDPSQKKLTWQAIQPLRQ